MKNLIFALALVIAGALASCTTKTTQTTNACSSIIGQWKIIEAMNQSTFNAEEEPYIIFNDSCTISGNTSVNEFFGNYYTNADSITFDQVGATLRIAEDMNTEYAIMSALSASSTFSIQDSIMCIEDYFGTTVMKLKR